MFKRLRDTEHSLRKFLTLIENQSSRVDKLSNSSSEQGSFNSRIDTQGGLSDVSITDTEALNVTKNASSNKLNTRKLNKENSSHSKKQNLV